jgi:penicillin G amidase
VNGHRRLLGFALGKRLARTSGSIRLDGPSSEIVIRRDGYGIPHIEAASDEDAAFAVGFCQGQDRAFQLEVLLRLARGTLAELAGGRTVAIDRLSRRIGFTIGADEQLAASGPELSRTVGAFARGVTAGGSAGLRKRPHEFVLLRSRPTPWKASDVIGVNRLIAFLIPSNWDAELARLTVLAKDGAGALLSLDDGVRNETLPLISGEQLATGLVAPLAEDLELLTRVAAFGSGPGSNSWAVSGERTATGRPLLGNDPHLAPTLPPHWYLVHVRTPAWQLAGAAYVGTPAVLVGFNGHGAWGVTSGLIDNTDLFLEELDGDRVREGDRFLPCEQRSEVITVRGGKTVTEDVFVTRNGPIISPALDGIDHAVSLRATWLDPRPLDGFLRSYKARTFEEFRRCFARWPCVPLNLVWADVSGLVGWQLAGEAPVRCRGRGLVPQPGWEANAPWSRELVPFDDMPFLSEPPDGTIVTANNQPVADGAGPYLGADWIEGFRAARLLEALRASDGWTVEAMLALQLDVKSVPWQAMRGAVLAATEASADERVRRGRALLLQWDGRVAATSPAASVYQFLVCELVRQIVERHAPRSASWAAGKGFHMLLPTTMYGRRRLGQLVETLRSGASDLDVAGALAKAVEQVRTRFGDDEERWAWGRARPFVLRHPLGARRPLARIFNLGPLPGAGDASTVAQAAVNPEDPAAAPSVVAALRAVIDVGDWDASRFSLPGGQSGNPCSPHYDDLLPFWEQGSGVPIAWSPDSVDRATRETLRLLPAQR